MKLKACAVLMAILAAGCISVKMDRGAVVVNDEGEGVLRHVVLFRFKEGTTPEQIAEIEKGFRKLPVEIEQIKDFEWGTDIGTENLADGFTHCFLVTFENEDARDTYVAHPAHKEFAASLKPHLDKVLVIDYLARE